MNECIYFSCAILIVALTFDFAALPLLSRCDIPGPLDVHNISIIYLQGHIFPTIRGPQSLNHSPIVVTCESWVGSSNGKESNSKIKWKTIGMGQQEQFDGVSMPLGAG